jgi:dTDP-4-amino-4,6-dideoxygalactose transaminase
VCLNQVVKIEPRRHRRYDAADAVLERLRESGYEVQGSYIPLHCLPEFREYAPRLPVFADGIWPHLIEPPCEPDVPLMEVERIADVLRLAVNGAE